MLNLRWSLLLGASISLLTFGCSSDDSVGNGGGTGGASSAAGGNKGSGGAVSAMGGAKATGGASTGMGGAGTATGGASAMTGSAPAATLEAIKAFIAAGTYKNAPWKADVATPRAAGSVSPHGMVRVWFNDTIQASAKAGNGVANSGKAHVTGSAVIKELYSGGNVIGHVAMVKKDGAFDNWAYYCDSTKALCGGTPADNTEASPFFGAGAATLPCGNACHFGNVYTMVP